MVVLSFLDTLKGIRHTLPPCQQPFYAGFWWLMRWYVRLPSNDQVYQSKLAKTAALRCFHSSAFGTLYGPGLGAYVLEGMQEIYMEACVDVQLDSDIATEVRDRLQKYHAREAFLKEVLCRRSASSGSSQLPLVQPSGSSLLPLMSSSSGSNELPQPPLVQDKKDKKAKDKKDKQHKKDKKDKLPLVQPPEDGHYYILLDKKAKDKKRMNEKDKKDKKDKKHKKAKRDLPEDMPEDPRQ